MCKKKTREAWEKKRKEREIKGQTMFLRFWFLRGILILMSIFFLVLSLDFQIISLLHFWHCKCARRDSGLSTFDYVCIYCCVIIFAPSFILQNQVWRHGKVACPWLLTDLVLSFVKGHEITAVLFFQAVMEALYLSKMESKSLLVLISCSQWILSSYYLLK